MWWEGCEAVHCGFWIDWEHGATKGSRLTLPNEWGLVLGAFVALFVKLGGEHFWKSICFLLHQINASPKKQDDVHHQHQLILRNPGSESSLILNLLKVSFAHQGTRFKSYQRSCPLVLLAIAHGIALYAAAGLSSRYISRSGVVQVISRTCGDLREPDMNMLSDDTSFEAVNAMLVLSRYGYRRSAAYARACYSQSSINTTACGSYIRSKLPYTITRNTPCPFDDKICNGAGITVESGHIRSDIDMGFNTQRGDAISIKKVLQCAPLSGEKYTTGWKPVPDELASFVGVPTGSSYKAYMLGSTTDARIIPQYTFLTTDTWMSFSRVAYDIGVATSFVDAPNKYTDVTPIPELQSPESDLYILSLVNLVNYRDPVNDPWFMAQNCSQSAYFGGANFSTCSTSNAMSFIGCQERYQFCTGDGMHCSLATGLDASALVKWPSDPHVLSPTQQALLPLLRTMMRMGRIFYQIGFVGRENLVASDYLWDDGFGLLFSAPLPNNQWEAEVQRWMDTALAMLQRSSSAWARPPEFDVGPGISSLKHIVPPQEAASQLCHKVKIRSSSHTSFSILGLGLTLSFGCFFILLSVLLPSLFSLVQRQTGKGLYKRLEWIESSGFQLQRIAAEGKGIGPWEGLEEDIPRLVQSEHTFNLSKEG